MTMEVNVTTTKIEQDEMDGIDAILHNLWEKKLLTDFDCRIIASSNITLKEKKAAVYTAIMSKSEEEAAILTEAFRSMTVGILLKENSTPVFNTSVATNSSILQSKNPLLINAIITHLFGFIPLKDIKRSRLVCREWNSTAELYLREKSVVHFRHDALLLPRTFIEVSKYSLPEAPFRSFLFSNDVRNEDSTWQISKIQDFFEKWGKNIKELTFRSVALTTKCNLTNREILISYYDVTPLFINLSNITSLKIKNPIFYNKQTTDEYEPKTTIDICLEEFVSIKNLSLKDCRLIVSAENRTRIALLSVDFLNVCLIQNGKIAKHLNYNHVVDFSKALNINLYNQWRVIRDNKFDMGKQVFHAKKLHLYHVDIDNWSQAKGDVEYLFLHLYSNILLERNCLKIKQLQICNCKIDLSALPETLETLKCEDVICSERFHLPNLKYLSISAKSIDRWDFSNCPLVELEIECYDNETFNLSLVPKSVKRLKMELIKLEFTGNCSFELDTLVLKGVLHIGWMKYLKAITEQIKSKVLVVVIDFANYSDISPNIQYVLTNNQSQSEKILFGSYSDLHRDNPFEGSELSKYVDKKSNFYQFENYFGKSITEAHFEGYANMKVYSLPSFYSSQW